MKTGFNLNGCKTVIAVKLCLFFQVTEESGALMTATPHTQQPAAPMNTPLHTPATFYDVQSESPSPTKVH